MAGLMRRGAFTAAVCGMLVCTGAEAQNFQLADLTGLWAAKLPVGSSTVYHVYQVTTGPSSLTVQWVRSETVNPLPGQGQTQYLPRRYSLTVADRSLSGSVTVGPGMLANCSFGVGTFPIQSGRISPDGNVITIVENHAEVSIYPACAWEPASGDTLMQLERYH